MSELQFHPPRGHLMTNASEPKRKRKDGKAKANEEKPRPVLRVVEDDGTPAEDGARLLDDVHTYLGRFVAYPSSQAHDAHALWVVHAHMMDAWDSTPRIAFLSPEPKSGKTRALEVTVPLVPFPVEAINVTPAYLFRKIGQSLAAAWCAASRSARRKSPPT